MDNDLFTPLASFTAALLALRALRKLQRSTPCTPAPSTSFGYDELFFGSRPVHLVPADGHSIHFDPTAWRVGDDPASIDRAIARQGGSYLPASTAAGGTRRVVVPAMPCLDYVLRGPASASTDRLPPSCTDLSAWPAALRRPLIKAKHTGGHPGIAKAVASGVRSALVKIGSTWYRLKGCGNNDEGFIVRKNVDNAALLNSSFADHHPPPSTPSANAAVTLPPRDPHWYEIRGCAFEHTAVRELALTSKVASALERVERGDRCRGTSCNRAMGLYRYGDLHQPLGPAAAPCCIVEETLGDRRLGTHVLAGIEILLPLIVDIEQLDVKALEAAFPPRRLALGGGGLVDTESLMTDLFMAFSANDAAVRQGEPPECGEHGLEWGDVERDAGILAFVGGGGVGGGKGASARIPLRRQKGDTLPPWQYTREGKKKTDPRWGEVWQAACTALNRNDGGSDSGSGSGSGSGDSCCDDSSCSRGDDSGGRSSSDDYSNGSTNDGGCGDCPSDCTADIDADRSAALGYLFSRLGYDAGRFMGGMHHDLKLSWGTYQDDMCRKHLGEWHCNAHSDNMVLLPPTIGAGGVEGGVGVTVGGADDSSTSFLGFLDLDMAFDGETSITDNATVGATEADHALLLQREHINFMYSLSRPPVPESASGDTTRHSEQAKAKAAVQGPVQAMVLTALLDTLLLGYLRGYTGEDRFPVAPFNARLHAMGYEICKLALVVTADCIA